MVMKYLFFLFLPEDLRLENPTVLLGHIKNKNENFVTDCAVWHNFPVLGGSARGCKAAFSSVLASRNWEPSPPRWTVLGYCHVFKCVWLAAAELMALVPGLEGAGNL